MRALERRGQSSPADATNWSSSRAAAQRMRATSRPSFDNTALVVILRWMKTRGRGSPYVAAPSRPRTTDGNRLTYTLEGPGKDSFTIVSSSGQIRTRAALNHEETEILADGEGERRTEERQQRRRQVGDHQVDELRGRTSVRCRRAPRVTGIAGSTDSVTRHVGRAREHGPPIIDYDVRYVARSRTAPGLL